ncbi:glycosyltransferase family 2 protein, partial [Serratia fonticola]|nr:glycosyltransferase family 2 protein [Serratia fonticola]
VLRSDNDTGVYLIKNNANLGFAGGNNVGVKFAFNQKDMDFVWLLNNDTEVLPSTLFELLKKFGDNKRFGICGSRLVYFYERDKIQGLGGTLNPWLCTSKHYAWLEPSNTIYNELNVESEIDYVLGASMMLSRDLIEKVGYLCEDYFLYFEEFDLCKRARSEGFDIGVASKSIVYHKEGASTKSGKSDVADYFSVRNRILITKKFFPRYIITVKISILGVIINRLIRKEFKRAFRYMKFIFM